MSDMRLSDTPVLHKCREKPTLLRTMVRTRREQLYCYLSSFPSLPRQSFHTRVSRNSLSKLPTLQRHRSSLIWKLCETPDQDKSSLVCMWMGRVSCPKHLLHFTLPHHTGALKHYFCDNKGHVRGKGRGRTTTLNLVPRPVLMESTACTLLASHSA